MKSKLTLRLDDELKEQAKKLADERGMSVSRLVENYFRLLLHDQSSGSGQRPDDAGHSGESQDTDLTPRIEKLREALGRPAPSLEISEDVREGIDAAARKHS